MGVGRVDMVITASNADQHLRTWRVLRKTGALEGASIKLEPLRELKLQELGIGALCSSTGMGVFAEWSDCFGFWKRQSLPDKCAHVPRF